MSDKQIISPIDFGKLMARVDAIAEHTKCLPAIKAELEKVKSRVQRNEKEIEKIRTGAWKAVFIFLGAIVSSLFAGISAHFK